MSRSASAGPAPAPVADRALDWVAANLDRFDPVRGRDEPDRERLKALVELAVLCMCLSRQPAFQGDARLRRFPLLALQTYRTPIFGERLFRAGTDFIPYALLGAALRACGLLDDDEEWRALQGVLDRGNVAATERVPHRMLELRHLLDLAGFTHRIPSYSALYRRTTLAQRLNPIYVTNYDAYSITHALFYLSDWGAHPPVGIPPSHRARASWLVEQLLGMYVRRGDWDLVGELLLSCHCLRRTDSPLYALGWTAFIAAQWPDGAVPGRGYDPQEAARREGEEHATYVFDRCYHTTLVAAFAGGLCPPP